MSNIIHRQRKGFTLVEIMITVAIVGLLAALAMPAFSKSRRRAQVNAYVEQLRVLGDAVQTYAVNQGSYPADQNAGACPVGLENDTKFNWATPTPLGYRWDFDVGAGCDGCKAAIACYIGPGGTSASSTPWQEVDALVDDGDLTTGNFKIFLGDRYGYVIEW